MISKYEAGEKSPSLPELEVLAYYLDVPLERFWEDLAPDDRNKMDSLSKPGAEDRNPEFKDRGLHAQIPPGVQT